MASKLKDLTVRMVALVDKGANQDAHITLVKRAPTETPGAGAQKQELTMTEQERAAQEVADLKAALAAKDAELAEIKGLTTAPGNLDTARKAMEAVSAELGEVRAQLQKQVAERTAELEASRAEVVKLHAAQRREDFIKFAHTYLPDLPGATADDFAGDLDDIQKALGDKRYTRFAGRLRSWNAVVQKSKVFEEIGRANGAPAWGSAEGALHAMATERAAQSGGKVTYEKAYDAVLAENPDLYTRYLAEKES